MELHVQCEPGARSIETQETPRSRSLGSPRAPRLAAPPSATMADFFVRAQSTSEVLMVSPTAFGFNAQAAADNHFVAADGATAGDPSEVRALVAAEHAELVRVLREEIGATVHLFDHAPEHGTPDAVFPNNWFSTLARDPPGGRDDPTLVLYPMRHPNRRRERRPDLVAFLRERYPATLVDLTDEEPPGGGGGGRFLEGTGSLVIDHLAKTAYACASERAHPDLARRWGEATGHGVVCFSARDAEGRPIYHTNVMMCVGTNASLVCLEAIADPAEAEAVRASLARDSSPVIEISLEQVGAFAGNALELRDRDGYPVLLMSRSGYESLGESQVREMRKYWKAVHAVAVPTLERIGGGSVRCCVAELF